MAIVHLKIRGAIDSDGHLRLDLATQLPAGEAEVALTITSANGHAKSRYDFSDIAGRLSWHGNAVAEQREIRNDW